MRTHTPSAHATTHTHTHDVSFVSALEAAADGHASELEAVCQEFESPTLRVVTEGLEEGLEEDLEEQSTNNHRRWKSEGRDFLCYPECNRSNPSCLCQDRSIHTLLMADVRKCSGDIARCSSIKVAMMGRSTPSALRVQEWGSTKTPTSRRSAAAGGTSDYISRRCVGGGGCACEDGTRKNTHSLIII